ncbi:MAG: TRM11 family SAM-dependent methyltransferase, partial [Planctomycetota bacterium]
RGNFAPQVVRNIIEMYSEKGDSVLDPMVGGGTTLIEAKLLARNALGLDVNPEFVKLTEKALKFTHHPASKQKVRVADARDLSFLKDSSFDLVLTHPPYLNIIKYSEGRIPADLSNIGSLPKFCDQIEKIAAGLFSVLKPDKYCAILIGDTRRGKHFVPLAFNVMQRFLKAGFVLKEDIVKVQHNCAYTIQSQTRQVLPDYARALIRLSQTKAGRKPFADKIFKMKLVRSYGAAPREI